jgi:hypothetical protein
MVTDEQAGEIRRQVSKEEVGCPNCEAMLTIARNPEFDDRAAVNEIAGMDWGRDCPTCKSIAGMLVPVLAERMSLDS